MGTSPVQLPVMLALGLYLGSGDCAVKNKTALKQAIASAKVSAILIAVVLALTFKYPTAYTIVPLVILVFFFQMEVVPGHSTKSLLILIHWTVTALRSRVSGSSGNPFHQLLRSTFWVTRLST
jgi:hypothetical protein